MSRDSLEIKGEREFIKRKILELLKNYDVDVSYIVLFGSRARGDYNKYSDYDLLIVTRVNYSINEKMLISKKIREFLSRFPMDIIVKSEEEVEMMKDEIGSIVREALKEGIIL